MEENLNGALKSAGIEEKEANRLTALLKSASRDELLYMTAFMDGMKMGERLERERQSA